MSLKKTRVKGKLSVAGIESIRKQIEEYRSTINKRVYTFAQKLAEQGVVIAKANITGYGAIFDGELIDSISARVLKADSNEMVFVIRADSEHAVFVEFGTGQRGLESPYPFDFPDGVKWDYNSGDKIFEMSTGQYFWFYPKDGKMHITQGLPARPFMHDTYIEMMQIVTKTAREVFKN